LWGRRLIKPQFQIKFSLLVFALMAASTMLFWRLGHGLVLHMSASGLIHQEGLPVMLRTLTNVMVVSVIFSWVVAFGATVFFSHMIAGPVYRLEKALARVKEGDLSVSVRLRRFDELKDLAGMLNEALASLRGKWTDELEFRLRAGSVLEGVSGDLARRGAAEESRRIAELAVELKDRPSPFKT
jgi:methyl-accepting chemotaxis protein